MPASQASRRLVKSPPELWAEVSDAASLAKHLGEVGEIRITRLEPETTVAWEGERASGTVELAPAGWGTSVTLTAEPVGEAAPAVEPAPPEPEPEPVAVTPEPEPEAVAAAAPEPARTPWFARLFRRKPAAAVEPQPVPEPEPVAVAEPEPVEPEPTLEPAANAASAADPLEAVLTGALDSLGAAHHRPFSRG